MPFENAKQIVQFAKELNLIADNARSRLDILVAENKISSAEARRAARKISALRDDAVDISFGAIHLVIEDFQLTQKELMGVVKDAKKHIEAIQDVSKFVKLLTTLVGLSAVVAAGNPGPIIASLNEVRKQVV